MLLRYVKSIGTNAIFPTSVAFSAAANTVAFSAAAGTVIVSNLSFEPGEK